LNFAFYKKAVITHYIKLRKFVDMFVGIDWNRILFTTLKRSMI